jgi:ActR/RegA family two-component response regulator
LCTYYKMALSHTVAVHDGGGAAMTQAKTSASHRVFLVDDDDALRTMMSLTLEHKGFEVVSAANVTEALKLLC